MSETISPLWQMILLPDIHEKHLQVVHTLQQMLEADGYSAYDPFPGGIGSPISKEIIRLRLFVAPPQAGWQRVFIGDALPAAYLNQLAAALQNPVLNTALLSDSEYQITVAQPDSAPQTSLAALQPFLQPGKSLADLQRADQETSTQANASSGNLPSELQQLAEERGVSARQVDKMVGRLTKQIFGKMEQDESGKDQAMAGLSGVRQPADWSQMAAQRLLAVMACLQAPPDWYMPDYGTLVSAYQAARQIKRGNTINLPTDRSALDKVPQALAYTPLYYYKRMTS